MAATKVDAILAPQAADDDAVRATCAAEGAAAAANIMDAAHAHAAVAFQAPCAFYEVPQQWEMDGKGRGIKGKKTAARLRRQAADANGDVWKDMTRGFHCRPECEYIDQENTLFMMSHNVYRCLRCDYLLWSMQRAGVRLLWSDYPIEGVG